MTEQQSRQQYGQTKPGLRAGARRAVADGLARITGGALAPYQTAVVRIGFAATWLFFLLREWPHREQLYGPGSTWGFDLAEKLVASNHAFTVLLWSDSEAWFEFIYLFAMASSLALLLGWRTRTASVLFMIGVLGLQNRSVFMGDGGDNVVHLMALYLMLTRCGRVWSLDARRRRTADRESERAASGDKADPGPHTAPDAGPGPGTPPDPDPAGVVIWSVLGAVLLGATVAGGFSTGWALLFWGFWTVHALWWVLGRYAPGSEVRTVCDILANLAHNAALLVITVEVCLIYATAGWYKIQGSRWQDGTAVYYPMQLDYFSPWPALGDVLAGSAVLTLLITYGTVIVQVAFPFTLFNRRVKNVLLALMVLEHLSIAVLLGLPFFSLAMVAADALFLPTALLVWTGGHASGLTARLRSRLGRGRGPGEAAGAGGGRGAPGSSEAAVGPYGTQDVPAPASSRPDQDSTAQHQDATPER